MVPRWSSFLCPAVLTMAALVLNFSSARNGHGQTPTPVAGGAGVGWEGSSLPSGYPALGGQRNTSTGMGGGRNVPEYFEVVCPGGCYGGGFHVFSRRAFAGAGYYGFFRRYWGYGFYGPNYNMGSFFSQCGATGFHYAATTPGHKPFLHGHQAGSALPCDLGGLPPEGGMNPASLPASEPGRAPAEKKSTPTGNKAHLQLLVPEKAEVLVDGVKTRMTGTVRDFVSPALTPGTHGTYRIVVRYADADGKPIEEGHSIRVHANDRLRIDCTRPTNTEPGRAAAEGAVAERPRN